MKKSFKTHSTITFEELQKIVNDQELVTLKLHTSTVSNDQLILIARSETIKKLSLWWCFGITTEGVKTLISTNITILNLYKSEISDESIKLLMTSHNIISLNLGNNNISNEGIKLIAANHNIVDLSLERNNISYNGALALATNKNLIILNLAYNNILSVGAKAFKHCYKLVKLDLYENPVCINIVIDLLQSNPYLMIKNNKYSHRTCKTLKELSPKCFETTINKEIYKLNEQHFQNINKVIPYIKSFINVVQQANIKWHKNSKLVAIKLADVNIPGKILYDLLETTTGFRLKLTLKLAIKLKSLNYTDTQFLADLTQNRNANFFKLTGIISAKNDNLADSDFAQFSPDLLCEITKYLSLKTQNGKIQLLVPHAVPQDTVTLQMADAIVTHIGEVIEVTDNNLDF